MSSENKFTPGPWSWGYEYNDCGARVLSIHNSEYDYVVDECGVTSEANANLITSAPELLEALELAHEHMKLWIPMYCEGENLYDDVTNAIAKAKGQDND